MAELLSSNCYCYQCQKSFGVAKDIFTFYIPNSSNLNDIHFIIAPEVVSILSSFHLKILTNIVDESKYKKKRKNFEKGIYCEYCGSKLGNLTNFGPNNCDLYCIGHENVIIGMNCSLSGEPVRKWSIQIQQLSFISKRGPHNFSASSVISKINDDQSNDKPFNRSDEHKLFDIKIFKFSWKILIKSNKTPTTAQIQAVVESIIRDTIVVMPTGTGKTLAAAMLLCQYVHFYPNKIAIMVAERVPLVFQQARSIRYDTNLKTMALCSENRSPNKLLRLNKNIEDVLVITAGSLINLLEAKTISLNNISIIVFDECHHATGNHNYCQILHKLYSCTQKSRPRLVGLSASPFSSTSYNDAKNSKDALAKKFFNANFCKPKQMSNKDSNCTVTWKKVLIDEYKAPLFSALSKYILDKTNELQNLLLIKQIIEVDNIKKGSWSVFIGQLRLARDLLCRKDFKDFNDFNKFKKLIEEIFCLVYSFEIADLIGLHDAIEHMKECELLLEIPMLNDLCNKYENKSSYRLQELSKILSSIDQNSESRILVFVDTRKAAQYLHQKINLLFPLYNAKRIVGKSGHDGMGKDEQQEVISDFNSGRCRLLVSTSVIEEGIDISACNVVVRFKGAVSLIQFIQLRGRARKEFANFYLIVTEEEYKNALSIEKQETILDSILSYASNISPEALDIISRMDSSESEISDEYFKSSEPFWESGFENNSESLSFYIPGFTFDTNGMDVIHCLTEAFLDIHIELKKYQLFRGGASTRLGFSNIFEEEDAFIICSYDSMSEKTKFDLCQAWDFKFDIDESHSLPFLLKMNDYESESISSQENICINGLNQIIVGEWRDYQTFYCYSELSEIWEQSSVSIDIKKRKLVINSVILEEYEPENGDYNCITSNYSIEFDFLSFSQFAIVSMDKSTNRLNLLFSTMYSARLYRHKTIEYSSIGRYKEENERIVLDGSNLIDYRVESDLFRLSENRTISLTFGISEWLSINKFISLLPVPVFAGKVSYVTMVAPTIPNYKDFIHHNGSIQTCVWTLLTILTDRLIFTDGSFKSLIIEKVMSNIVENRFIREMTVALQQLPFLLKTISLSSKISAFEIFLNSLNTLMSITDTVLSALLYPIQSENWYYVKRVIVTPSRIVILPFGFIKGSRFLRKCMKNKEDIIIVLYADENFQKAREGRNRLSTILSEGLNIGGVLYRCLCGSNSQIREQSYYFIRGDKKEIMNRRDNIVDFNLTNVAKISKQVNNLSLFCTCDTPIIDIRRSRWKKLDDSKSFDGHLNTDGSGFISSKMALNVLEKMEGTVDMRIKPSAFQIRMGGLKGVFVVDSTNILSSGEDIGYRDSMVKCESQNTELCIVKSCNYVDLYLAHESINLLSSLGIEAANRGIPYYPDSAILSMHESELEKIASIFLDQSIAFEVLSEYVDCIELKCLKESNFDILTEPMWVMALHKVYQIKINSLIKKSRIFVQEGCMLTGIPDRNKSLKYNEVFFQIQKSGDAKPTIITGPVLIYRHPCLHPGDFQICMAVNEPKLNDLINVLVLSIDPNGPSLSSCCSGGDLDGDQFAIIFDKNLVPQIQLQQKSLDYEELAIDAEFKKSLVTNCKSIEDFYFKIACNEYLGRIANMHLAYSDFSDLGAHDPLAMKLASQQSIAVDMPKTGIIPEVPKEAVEKIKAYGYPDFMRKEGKDMYASKKLLGTMYRRCLSLSIETELPIKQNFSDILLFKNIVGNIDDEDKFIEEASLVFCVYKSHVLTLMNRFGLNSEIELYLCTFLSSDSVTVVNKINQKEALKTSWNSLKEKIRNFFFCENSNRNNSINKLIESEKYLWYKAYIWYKVSYESKEFLCFPWILNDVLCDMSSNSGISEELFLADSDKIKSVNHSIGHDVLEMLHENMIHIYAVVTRGQRIFDKIVTNISKTLPENSDFHCEIKPFGSFALGLCEPGSDIDIYVDLSSYPSGIPEEHIHIYNNKSLKDQNINLLDKYIVPVVEEISLRKECIYNTSVPIIRCMMDYEEGDDISVDICLNRTGVDKATYIIQCYLEKKGLFSLFLIIFKIFRSVNFIRSALITSTQGCFSDDPILKTTELHALILHTMDMKAPFSDNSKIESIDPLVFFKELEKSGNNTEQAELLGANLLSFLRSVSKLKDCGEFIYHWPIDKKPLQRISPNVINRVAELCTSIFHCLAYSKSVEFTIKNINAAFNSNLKKHVEIPVSRSAANSISLHKAFHLARLEYKTGAKVTIISGRNSELHNNTMCIVGYGNMMSVRSLRDAVKLLMYDCKLSSIGNIRDRSSAYFMKDATCIYILGSNNKDEILCCSDYFGPTQIKHRTGSTKVPHQINNNNELAYSQWVSYFESSVREKLITQLYTSRNDPKSPLIPTFMFTASFGIFYLNRVESFLESTNGKVKLNDLEKAIHTSKRSRIRYDRVDFTKQRNQDEKENFEMIKLNNASSKLSRSSFSFIDNNDKLKSLKKNKNISTGFYPCSIENIDAELPRLCNILSSCGFSYIETLNELKFKITFSVSASFSMELVLNNEFKLLRIHQKPLSWVSGTVLNSNNFYNDSQNLNENINLLSSPHHVRFKAQTSELVDFQSDMFKIAYPVNNDDVAPIYLDQDNIARPNDKMPKTSYDRLVHIRQTECRIIYRSQLLEANINSGYNLSYSSGKLLEKKHFCELSINSFKENIFIDWLLNKPDKSIQDANKWCEEVLKSIIEVSQAILKESCPVK